MGGQPAGTARRATPFGLFRLVREDLQHNRGELSRPGFHALVAYRIGNWARQRPDSASSRILGWAHRPLASYVRFRFGIDLHPAAKLGRRLSIGHQGGIHVGPDVAMGDDCEILQGARLGRSDHMGASGPRIGNGVRVGARASIQGPLQIGDDARIGPNAVIANDVPSGTAAIARPSQVRRQRIEAAATAASDGPIGS